MSTTTIPPDSPPTLAIDEVFEELAELQRRFESARDPRRHFVATYARTTAAVRDAVRRGRFEDAAWVDRWDAVFARLYLDALAAYDTDPRSAPRPWRVAFRADADLPALRLVLLGMNAHINYDLPRALLAVIDPVEFEDPELLGRRRRDHERIDTVLAARVSSEDRLLDGEGAARVARSALDRLLVPVNRAAARRLLAESRRKVWVNAGVLHAARVRGDAEFARALAELEVLSASRIADLLLPGHVLLRLATCGFGCLLPTD